MANFTKVSESGQIEIDWSLLQAATKMSDVTIEKLSSKVNAYLNRKFSEYEIVGIEDFEEIMSIYIMDEKVIEGDLIRGNYVTIFCDKTNGTMMAASMSHYDFAKFGYEKVKGAE